MNYIILNNKNSNRIKGLIIQELPPITKPMIRVNREEIDGRDGDITTKLGYSAYDKTIQIGLSYDYDVDEIIKYFDSEGIVIFSNEPTKYYKYQIEEQIDFEKLIRFKTASVTMHVQPFKYSTLEGVISSASSPLTIFNGGNIYSKPILNIEGSGDISIYLDGIQLFQIALGDEENITIDIDKMEAYKGAVLKNRLVQGDYDKFKLNVGRNVISFTGNVTNFSINNYSRWI